MVGLQKIRHHSCEMASQVKLQGLDNELDGRVGTLRTLVASTGKFSIELDGDPRLHAGGLKSTFAFL